MQENSPKKPKPHEEAKDLKQRSSEVKHESMSDSQQEEIEQLKKKHHISKLTWHQQCYLSRLLGLNDEII